MEMAQKYCINKKAPFLVFIGKERRDRSKKWKWLRNIVISKQLFDYVWPIYYKIAKYSKNPEII